MSRVLSELLGAAEPAFSLMIRDLEAASGQTGVDISLSVELKSKVRLKLKELGLDPKDTNGRELYHGLLMMVEIHDQHLRKALGSNDQDTTDGLLTRIKEIVGWLDIPKDCWAIKHSVVKRLLIAQPPKTIMKQLGYRSVESMLKRENVGEILTATQFAQSPQWLRKFKQQYHKLTPNDFESRSIEIISLESKRWGDLTNDFIRSEGHNICVGFEVGTILLLPLPVAKLKGLSITVLPLLLERINDIRNWCAYFKLHQVHGDFGKKLAQGNSKSLGVVAKAGGQDIHWRVVQRHLGSLGPQHHPENFTPHLTADDLAWRRAEESLYTIEPSLAFWRGLDYVGAMFETPVSLNLRDVAVSYVNNLEYGDHCVYHFQDALWNEIFIRYMGQKAFEQEVLRQMEFA